MRETTVKNMKLKAVIFRCEILRLRALGPLLPGVMSIMVRWSLFISPSFTNIRQPDPAGYQTRNPRMDPDFQDSNHTIFTGKFNPVINFFYTN